MSEEEAQPENQANGANGHPQHTNSGRLEEKLIKGRDKLAAKQEKIRDKANPPGGHDDSPIPTARDGYTVKFTFHRAENLPVADLSSRSSDPYVHATLNSALPKRHKEDPDLTLRTRTIHKNVNPEWNTEWIVAGIPSSGFRLKCRLYDEDTTDHDDRLGNVTIHVNHIDEDWPGIEEQNFGIKKRMGSKRAYLLRGIVATFNRNVHMSGNLVVSAEVIGKSDEPYGRMYTVGRSFWFKHYSPMIGRMLRTKAPSSSDGQEEAAENNKSEKYDFQANEMQLQGPVPLELYHRFVEFKPFVKGMFAKTGLRGRILNKALHHQHARVYNFSSSTEYGVVKPKSEEASLQFLKLCHFDEGGRIFTYALTLDGLLRFTETGNEFGIDLLSKHTMHSDVDIYIAWSGEFFIRRLAHPNEPTDAPNQKSHPDEDIPGGPPNEPPPENPKNYELIIDNDSGTYRPNGDLLPKLKEFLNENFPGLHVVTKECTDDELDKMKEAQRERKKKEGQNIELVQNSDSEISSSDEANLDRHRSGRKKPKQRAYDALEDPSKAFKELIPGKGKHEAPMAVGNSQARGESAL